MPFNIDPYSNLDLLGEQSNRFVSPSSTANSASSFSDLFIEQLSHLNQGQNPQAGVQEASQTSAQSIESQHTITVTKLSQLDSSLVDQSTVDAVEEILQEFGKEMRSNPQAIEQFGHISNTGDRLKNAMVHSLISISEDVRNSSGRVQERLMEKLSRLDLELENKQLAYQLQFRSNANTSNKPEDIEALIRSNNPNQIMLAIEKQLSALYSPLINLDKNSSDDDDSNGSNGLLGGTSSLVNQASAPSFI